MENPNGADQSVAPFDQLEHMRGIWAHADFQASTRALGVTMETT